jgi:hypothetical protein
MRHDDVATRGEPVCVDADPRGAVTLDGSTPPHANAVVAHPAGHRGVAAGTPTRPLRSGTVTR